MLGSPISTVRMGAGTSSLDFYFVKGQDLSRQALPVNMSIQTVGSCEQVFLGRASDMRCR
jgi:hypothetical protein